MQESRHEVLGYRLSQITGQSGKAGIKSAACAPCRGCDPQPRSLGPVAGISHLDLPTAPSTRAVWGLVWFLATWFNSCAQGRMIGSPHPWAVWNHGPPAMILQVLGGCESRGRPQTNKSQGRASADITSAPPKACEEHTVTAGQEDRQKLV